MLQIGGYMIELNKYEQEEFDSYTKEQIYEAYVTESCIRKKLNRENNDLRREIAKMKYELKRMSRE